MANTKSTKLGLATHAGQQTALHEVNDLYDHIQIILTRMRACADIAKVAADPNGESSYSARDSSLSDVLQSIVFDVDTVQESLEKMYDLSRPALIGGSHG